MKQCIICSEEVDNEQTLNSHSTWGHVLCRVCHDRAREIGNIPAMCIKKGWDAYDRGCSWYGMYRAM